MRTATETVIVKAGADAVWEVLTEPYYIPKLYPDTLNIKVDPEGAAVVGQKRTVGARAGKRIVEINTEVVGLAPPKRFEVRGTGRGAFEDFSQVVELTPVTGGTEMKVFFSFKVSESYFGPEFNLLTIEQAAVRNQQVYIKNVKELAELSKVA